MRRISNEESEDEESLRHGSFWLWKGYAEWPNSKNQNSNNRIRATAWHRSSDEDRYAWRSKSSA